MLLAALDLGFLVLQVPPSSDLGPETYLVLEGQNQGLVV